MRTKTKTFILLSLIFSILIFTGCQGGSSGGSDNDRVGWIDITGAESLMIISDSDGRSASDENPLYKITEDGDVVEAEITDEEGGEYESEYWPNGIFNIDDDYVIITFGDDYFTFDERGMADYAYLTRKSDGAVFEIPDAYTPTQNDDV